jgi:Secretion system C-terminal sorting domain
MKTMFIQLSVIVLMMFFILPSKILAANDTLVVFANGPSLDEIINQDTTSTGLQAHSGYKLVSRDTTYLFLGPVSVKSNLTVVGVLGSDGRPPCIQPGVLGDGSIPAYLFVMNGSHTIGTFKNLYITGLAVNNSISELIVNNQGSLIELSADYIKLYVDNVIFEDYPTSMISYSGNWDDIFVTNCKFRNGVSATAWYSGEAVRNKFNTAITDSIVMKYNTVFCINSYAAGPVTVTLCKYFEFTHNNVLYNFQNPFWIFNVTDAKVNNNIFYANWVGGMTITEYEGLWDQLWSKEVGSIIDLDTLDIAKDSVFNPTDYGKPDFRMLSEAKRTIEVKNNVCFWPKIVTDFWTAWNDTAHVDSIYTPTWMNTRTNGMFSDKTHWPNLVESGNLNVDPGFGASIDQVMLNNTGNGAGLIQYFIDIRTNVASTNIYGYKLQSISGNNWIPQWPLPEITDMKYSNTALLTGGTDGKPIGDPYWFYGVTGIHDASQSVPNQFALYNAYPNPFNPSTKIKFNIGQAGNVSLKIYNVMGQLVKTVIDNAYKNSGQFEYSVKMDNLTSGIYFYTLTQGNQTLTKKMVLLK